MPGCDLKGKHWRDLPRLDRKEGDVERHSACPHVGGHDRVVIWPEGGGPQGGPARIWCRFCGMQDTIGPDGIIGGVPATLEKHEPFVPEPRRPTLDPEIAELYHRSITPEAYRYFASRGISKGVADYYKLGWKEVGYYGTRKYSARRYSIPGYVIENGEWILYGIQLRSSERYSDKKKRYVSEKGSINQILFNTQVVAMATSAYILVVESPLDAMALRSFGYPAVSPFDGNAKGAWKSEWTVLLSRIPERIIIPDNDENGAGEVLAADKKNEIPRSRLLWLPKQYGDVGKLIEADLTGQKLRDLLKGLPPILGEL